MLKEFTSNSLVTNSIIELGEVIDDTQGKGRSFVSRFIEAGVAHYKEFGDVLITKETLDKFIHTMIGCPVIINHKDITEKNADKERVGVVCEVWFEPLDGWYYCKGIIWDKQAIDLIKNQGWNVSCTYDFESDFIEKTHNGKKIDMEFTNGKFLHLALVNNPRYERANIVVNSKEQAENDFVDGNGILRKDNGTFAEVLKDKMNDTKEEEPQIEETENPKEIVIDDAERQGFEMAQDKKPNIIDEINAEKAYEENNEVQNSTKNRKDKITMSLFKDLEKFVENAIKKCEEKEKFEEEETIVENEDKRKIIDEVGGILKDKVDEEVWRTVIGKLEKIAYEPSEETKADNKCKNEDEEDEEEYEEMKEIAEDVEDKKGKKEEKKEEKEEEKKEVKNSMDDVAKMVYGQAETVKSYTTTAERLELGNNY